MKRWLWVGLWLLVLTVTARADLDTGELLSSLPEELRQSGLSGLPGEGEAGGVLEKLWQRAEGRLRQELGQLLRPALAVVAAALITSGAESLMGEGANKSYVNLCGCMAVAAVSLRDVGSVLVLGKETVEELAVFGKALLPTLSTAATAAGAAGSAPAKYAMAVLFEEIFMSAVNGVIVPMVGIYLAAGLAEAVLPGRGLGEAARLLKRGCVLLLTGGVSVFTLFLTAGGLIAASTDAMALKAAKSAVSTLLPVVGKIVADAAGQLVAGAGVLRASVGVLGLLGVLSVCLLPFFTLGLRYLLFKAAGALAAILGGQGLSRLVEHISGACGMMLALVGTQALALFAAVIALCKAVSG